MLGSALNLLNGLFMTAVILLMLVSVAGSIIAALRAVGRSTSASIVDAPRVLPVDGVPRPVEPGAAPIIAGQYRQRGSRMKSVVSSIVVLVLALIAGSQKSSAAVDESRADISAPEVRKYIAEPENNAAVTEVVRVEPQRPRGPNDVLEDYESEMAKVTSQMSHELGEICAAMANGQLSREQGEYLARERYQVATMQFQLLSALHAILEQSVAQASAAPAKDAAPANSEALVLALPFSSLQLDSSLARYLQLTPEQVSDIGQVMAGERPLVAPLMAELDATRQKLEMATRNTHPDQKEISSLALAQARLITKLVAENSDLQAKISRLLNAEQRKKVEKLKQSSEVSGLTGE